MRYLRYSLVLICLLAGLAYNPLVAGAQNLRILLTNDDGFESPGIIALKKELRREGHNVFVIAPATRQSGKSAAVTARGIRFAAHPGQVWSVEGTPADAVRLGIGYIMYNNPPDLVVSGANFGQNTGQDVHISGTVGAALTAYRLGIPAIAVSVAVKLEEAETGFPSTIGALGGVARLTARLVRNLELPDLTAVLNVNYPAALPLDIKGVRWSPLSQHSIIGTRYYRQPDGTFAPELQQPHPHARAFDAESLLDGYVTLTFLDGDTYTSTDRSQRYLARDLLDRSYEPTYDPPTTAQPREPGRSKTGQGVPLVPATPPARPENRAKPEARPEAEPETTPIPRRRPAMPKTTVPERRPESPVIKLGTDPQQQLERRPEPEPRRRIPVREEVITLPDDAPPERQVKPDPAERPPVEQLPPPSAQEQATREEQAGRQEETGDREDKPDSWLRRMFDPDSWRR